MYNIKDNDIVSLSDLATSPLKQIYLLNTYIFWLSILEYYKIYKKRSIRLKLYNKIFYLYKGFTKNYSLFNLKLNYVITQDVSSAFTLLRSPMAQKKFSKEQVGFQYYNVTFNVFLNSNIFLENKINLNQLKNLLYIINLLKIEFYEIFSGLFLFHGFNILIFIRYSFIPLWYSI